MQNEYYDIKTVLNTIFNTQSKNIKKRIIYDQSPIGGISSKWIKIVLFVMPFAMYAAIFNPRSFEYLGIAQAIVFYIILLVFAMQIVIGVAYFNNKAVVKKVTPSWQHYFKDVDFKMILSSGVTPYVDFTKHYEKTLKDNLDNKQLHTRLKEAFVTMENENKILIDAINRDKNNQAGK